MGTMPVLFISHGSPMTIIEENDFIGQWREIAARIPRPRAILCISAHWYQKGHHVSLAERPRTIHDFFGFPGALYDIRYPAPGAPDLARRTAELLGEGVTLDPARGLDHGAWCVLHIMYPKADIPVCQLSVNAPLTTQQSYDTGRLLAPLREDGVLILGSGDVIHNLGIVDVQMKGGYPWADEFDAYIKDAIERREYDKVINYTQAGAAAKKAFVYRDHFDPLLYVLGATTPQDRVSVFNDARVMGSLSMTSYLFES